MLIEMEGLLIKLHRKRVKNLNLRIQRTGDIQVSAPQKLPLSTIYTFLSEKRFWIDTQLQRLQTMEPIRSRALLTGERVNYLGQRFELKIHEGMDRGHVELTDGILHFYIKPTSTLEQKQHLLKRWYHMKMQQYLPGLFSKWEAVIGVSASQYGIKMMKTRWGSCNTVKKRIWLNLRLIEKPLICLEYVIVHELVHLLEASHNKRFYALMNQFMPDWKLIKKRLELQEDTPVAS